MREIVIFNRSVAAALVAVALAWLVPMGAARAQTTVSMGSAGDHWASMLDWTHVGAARQNGVAGYKVKLRAADGCKVTLFYPRSTIDFQGQGRAWLNLKVKVKTGWLYYPSRLNARSVPKVHPGVLEIDDHCRRQAEGAIAAARGFGNVATLGTMTPVPRSVPPPRTPRTHTPRVRSPRTTPPRTAPARTANGSRTATSAARGGGNRLKTGISIPRGNAKFGLEHIVRRHSFRTGADNVSKFSRGMGHQEIRSLIHEAAGGTTSWRVQGSKRALDTNMGRVIGTDQSGNAVKGLRVVTDANGTVITAYPIGL